MRRVALPAVLVLAVLPLGCGDEPKPPRNEPEVTLSLSGPADAATVRTGSATITGTVRPAAAKVRVLGRDVSVDGGSFSTDVELQPGANLIDVDASAPSRRPDFAVLRVVYEQRVSLPDVSDPEGWNEALRLRALIDSLERGNYRVAGVLGADGQLTERLATLAPDVVIVDAESGARDAIEHVVWAT